MPNCTPSLIASQLQNPQRRTSTPVVSLNRARPNMGHTWTPNCPTYLLPIPLLRADVDCYPDQADLFREMLALMSGFFMTPKRMLPVSSFSVALCLCMPANSGTEMDPQERKETHELKDACVVRCDTMDRHLACNRPIRRSDNRSSDVRPGNLRRDGPQTGTAGCWPRGVA